LKAGVEMAFNRDIRTGQRIYDPHAPGKVMTEQIGRRLLASVAPVDQGLQVAEGKLDVKKLMYSMVGVSFPLHGAEKLASMINAERMAALPPQDEAAVIHSVKRSRALHDAWNGDRRALDALLDSDEYTRKEKLAIRKASLMPPIVYETKNMAYPDFVRVYNAATEEQKQQLRIPMARKLAALRKAGKQAPADDE
jgi:negative regulator of replication initiation